MLLFSGLAKATWLYHRIDFRSVCGGGGVLGWWEAGMEWGCCVWGWGDEVGVFWCVGLAPIFSGMWKLQPLCYEGMLGVGWGDREEGLFLLGFLFGLFLPSVFMFASLFITPSFSFSLVRLRSGWTFCSRDVTCWIIQRQYKFVEEEETCEKSKIRKKQWMNPSMGLYGSSVKEGDKRPWQIYEKRERKKKTYIFFATMKRYAASAKRHEAVVRRRRREYSVRLARFEGSWCEATRLNSMISGNWVG